MNYDTLLNITEKLYENIDSPLSKELLKDLKMLDESEKNRLLNQSIDLLKNDKKSPFADIELDEFFKVLENPTIQDSLVKLFNKFEVNTKVDPDKISEQKYNQKDEKLSEYDEIDEELSEELQELDDELDKSNCLLILKSGSENKVYYFTNKIKAKCWFNKNFDSINRPVYDIIKINNIDDINDIESPLFTF